MATVCNKEKAKRVAGALTSAADGDPPRAARPRAKSAPRAPSAPERPPDARACPGLGPGGPPDPRHPPHLFWGGSLYCLFNVFSST